jgi:protocatechuate 3,4-dioxygenase beta subunit
MATNRRGGNGKLTPTAHQTTGPFFPAQYIRAGDNDLARLTSGRAKPEGDPYFIYGHVTDGSGSPAVNVIIETWQADAAGRFNHPGFFGWGRTWTDREGFYSFTTIKPGAYQASAGNNRWFAPRLSMRLIGSGLMRPLITAVYFPGEMQNADDPQLQAITNVAARQKLIAASAPHRSAPSGVPALRYDICLGGRNASTFLQD